MLLAQLAHISVPLQPSFADSQSQPFIIMGFQPNKGQPEISLSCLQKQLPFFDGALFTLNGVSVKYCSMGLPTDDCLEGKDTSLSDCAPPFGI